MSAAKGCESFAPGRLWSLWDLMINYQFLGLCKLLENLHEAHEGFAGRQALIDIDIEYETAPKINETIEKTKPSDQDRAYLLDCLKRADGEAFVLGLEAVKDKVSRFRQRIQGQNTSVSEIKLELKILLETLESDLYKTYFHAYDSQKVLLIKNVNEDWIDVFAKLQKSKEHIVAAMDCYAIGHNLGTIFYLMYAMEIAVHEFGKKLGVNLAKANPGRRISELSWENILNALNPKLKAVNPKTVPAKRRFEKLSAIQSYLYAVKDAWRNPTMHPRSAGYSDLETLNIINHVRSFMSEFAGVI